MTSRSVGTLETFESEDKLFTKHILDEGHGDSTPNEGSVCVINIMVVGSEGVGDVADEDLGGYRLIEDVEIVIGEGDSLLSELFDRIFMTMKEGERAYIKTKVDAKCHKVDDSLPGQKSTLKFNVLLRSFNRAADIGELEPDEKLERAEHHKERGTAIYQQNNVDFGLRRFRKALEYLNSILSVDGFSNAMISRMNTLKCHCNLNLAAGYLKQEEFEKVIDHCTVALTLEPNNVKGLFRRAQAHAKVHKYDEARKDLLRARELRRREQIDRFSAEEHRNFDEKRTTNVSENV